MYVTATIDTHSKKSRPAGVPRSALAYEAKNSTTNMKALSAKRPLVAVAISGVNDALKSPVTKMPNSVSNTDSTSAAG